MLTHLEPSWGEFIITESQKPYFQKLLQFLNTEKKAGKTIYPEDKNVFSAFKHTPFSKIKVVIIGQDPYHGENQAHGLSFSVPTSQTKIPPSLKNIFKEMKQNINSGNLEYLAKQGVFLLNATLTVEAKKAGSHQKKGWEIFTDTVIKKISDEKENIVFLLWGNFAQKKSDLIDQNKHFILKTSHPSPLSAYRGFLGSHCFIDTNKYLEKNNIETINWINL